MSRDIAAIFADIDAFDPDKFVGDLVRDWQIYIDVTPVFA